MAEQVNIYIDQGTDFNLEFEVFDDTTEVNYNDYDFFASMRKVFSSSNFTDFVVTKDGGMIQISLPKETTYLLQPGKYSYDVMMVDNSSSSQTKIIEGIAFVLQSVTRTANTA